MTAKLVQVKSALDMSDFTARQGEVLDAALAFLVETGDSLTMAAVTRAASCSKETLYNWFGDREGLLVAIVRWQAAKVRMPDVDLEHLERTRLIRSIEEFGASLLGVLTGEISVALNRLAIAHGGNSGSNLGKIVLENGRFAMGRQLKPILEAGKRAGLLKFEDAEPAFTVFFGLLVRDSQIRLLLGDDITLSAQLVKSRARSATKQFMELYAT